MIANNTCVSGNETSECPASSSSVGLAVGLTLLFLLLVVSAAVILFKYHSKVRNMLSFGQRRSLKMKKEECTEAQEESRQYTSMRREQPGQTPIYENLTRCNKTKFPGEPEEDVYLQCDSPGDAIYSNDPACNLSILPERPEEDVYVVPDS